MILKSKINIISLYNSNKRFINTQNHVYNNIKKNIPKSIIKNNLIIAKNAKGSFVFDINDDKYLDFSCGIGSINFGHNHPKINNAIKNQLDMLTSAQQSLFYSHISQNILIQKLLPILPKKHDNIFFANSGSECVENALKIAKMSTGKSNVVALNGGFHGRTLGCMSISSNNISYKKGFGQLFPCFFINEFTKSSVDLLFQKQVSYDDVSCIILEVIQGENGVRLIPKEFITYLRKICDLNNIVLIFDEIQSGIGRAGSIFAFNKYTEVEPDLICVSKSIANGAIPFGFVSGNSKIFNKMTPNSLGGTFNGNALGCVAASCVIDIMNNDNIIENTNKMGKIIKNELNILPKIMDERQFGLFISIDLPNEINSLDFLKKCAKNNLIIHSAAGNSLRIMPPLNTNEEEIGIFLDTFKKVLNTY
tara:strand:+ start:95 stop:1357 length:1263 start_codon:yes stop_codon:yes gene_type:complete